MTTLIRIGYAKALIWKGSGYSGVVSHNVNQYVSSKMFKMSDFMQFIFD